MKIAITIFAAFCALGSAQTKISGEGKCTDKPETQQSVDVGDRSGHMLMMIKQSCNWTTPIEMEGLKAKSYTVSIFSDVSGTKSSDRGYVVITMDNGDKAFVRVQGTAMMGKNGPESGEGTWSYTGGTGKLKGLMGKGTYKSKTEGEAGIDTIEGEYSIGAAKAKK